MLRYYFASGGLLCMRHCLDLTPNLYLTIICFDWGPILDNAPSLLRCADLPFPADCAVLSCFRLFHYR
jgi:hypothetical protein